jgi:hypothetical protein
MLVGRADRECIDITVTIGDGKRKAAVLHQKENKEVKESEN